MSQSDQWRTAQRLADLYRSNRNPRVREEAALVLFNALVAEGQMIAYKKLPAWRPREAKDVALDAAVSIISKQQFTVLLESYDPEHESGASMRTYLARKMDWKIADYARKEKWYDKPLGVPDSDSMAPTLSPFDIALGKTGETVEGSANSDPERAFEHQEFWQIAKDVLSQAEIDVLQSHLLGYPVEEGAEALGIPVGTYKSRFSSAKKKLAKRYTDLPIEQDEGATP